MSYEQSRMIAQKAAKGRNLLELRPGMLVTMSTCKATGDRSYTHDIWEIVATNDGTVIVKATGLCEKPWTDKPRAILFHEREFYPAEALAEAIRNSVTAES